MKTFLFQVVTVSCLICSSLPAARYTGSGQLGGVSGQLTGRQDYFLLAPLIWTFDVDIDGAQNVDVRSITFGADKASMAFVGDVGGMMSTNCALTNIELDLNPTDVAGQYAIKPFFVRDIEISGSYHNFGFENEFSGVYTAADNVGYWLGLDYANYPETLTIFPVWTSVVRFPYGHLIALEPGLTIGAIDTVFGDNDDARITLSIAPPDPTPYGDSNRDGRFDSSDLVAVFQAGQYEDSIVGNSTWETGDWNSDLEFDSGDLVVAFQAGKYEIQQALSANKSAISVPEPCSILIVLGAFVWAARRIMVARMFRERRDDT